MATIIVTICVRLAPPCLQGGNIARPQITRHWPAFARRHRPPDLERRCRDLLPLWPTRRLRTRTVPLKAKTPAKSSGFTIDFNFIDFIPPLNEGPHPLSTGHQSLEGVIEAVDTQHMENFPTPKRVTVPRAANLLTVAFLAATTWWSGAQRPVSVELPSTQSASTAAKGFANKSQQIAVDSPAQLPRVQAPTSFSSDGIIAVGYAGSGLR